jgi:hypothetical protein
LLAIQSLGQRIDQATSTALAFCNLPHPCKVVVSWPRLLLTAVVTAPRWLRTVWVTLRVTGNSGYVPTLESKGFSQTLQLRPVAPILLPLGFQFLPLTTGAAQGRHSVQSFAAAALLASACNCADSSRTRA